MQEIPILFELIHGPVPTIYIKLDSGGRFWFATTFSWSAAKARLLWQAEVPGDLSLKLQVCSFGVLYWCPQVKEAEPRTIGSAEAA